jgi:gamma-glutamylcyclotransferase (GGCT)/AIG2-like uncharacterized protein YtfP
MRIFVYGSLRRKQGNSHWMTNAQWLGDYNIEIISCTAWATIQARFRAKEQYMVKFIVLMHRRWPNWTLRTKGGEYARQLIQTPYGSAWMYVYQRPVEG